MRTDIAVAADLVPYYLIQALLPGATLVALLLWLTAKFLRVGFDDVRQYANTPPRAPKHVSAARRRGVALGLCLRQCTVVQFWRGRFKQWCDRLGQRVCCA